MKDLPEPPRLLMLTGVRQGESAARDQRISVSCSKNGGECGQGWFQKMTVSDRSGLAAIDTLAPLLHWRVCHVWDYLVTAAIALGFETHEVAEAYSMTQSIENGEEPLSTRTGCMGCPLVSTQDTALANICKQPAWAYLSPLLRLRWLHDELRKRGNRLRKGGWEYRKSGDLVANQGRYGPLKLEVRLWALEFILELQREVNAAAQQLDRPKVSIINCEEEAFTRQCIDSKVFPDKWTGEEPGGEVLIPERYSDGSVQPLLFAELEN